MDFSHALRSVRQRRRLSQLDLALRAGTTQRHLSFMESGRSRPGRSMVVRLSESMELPLRERNELLLAAGYAPVYPQTPLDDPRLEHVRTALRHILTGHLPYPAIVVDARHELVLANDAFGLLTEGVAEHLLRPPVNVLRLSLHPDGMASRIANLAQWRGHLLGQVRRRAEDTGDDRLRDLHAELVGYPGGIDTALPASNVVLPLRLRHETGELSFFSIAATVETAADVTVDELVIESFYPADLETSQRLRALV
jgi:transcriptional regulator with XRE-family HTH domain